MLKHTLYMVPSRFITYSQFGKHEWGLRNGDAGSCGCRGSPATTATDRESGNRSNPESTALVDLVLSGVIGRLAAPRSASQDFG